MLLGIIGFPLAYTRSPQMHETAMKSLGINGRYDVFPVETGKVGELLDRLEKEGYRGVNVTIPHKLEVMKYLDKVDDEARSVGSVNTILFKNGERKGFNTDIKGFRQSFFEKNIKTNDKNFLLLGAGGAARACAHVISGFSPDRFTIANRTINRAEKLAEVYRAQAIDMSKAEEEFAEYDIIINTVPAGVVKPGKMKPGSVLFDIRYGIDFPRREGIRFVDGLLMLVLQGAESLRIWTGKEPPVAVMKQAAGYVDDL